MKQIRKTVSIYILPPLILLSCSAAMPLRNATPQLNEYIGKIADSCFYGLDPGSDINRPLADLKALLDEVYRGELLPQSDSSRLDSIYAPGLSLQPYPPDAKIPGAIVARSFAVPISRFEEAQLWPDQVEVFGPERYISVVREYDDGDPADFLGHVIDSISYFEDVVDVGDKGISFRYRTYNTLKRYGGGALPEEGADLLCMQMQGEAEKVTGGYNAYMTRLYSLDIHLPADGGNTYRVVASWVEAGGSLFIFGASANSGNIGEGIITEFEGLSQWLASD